MTHTHIYVHTRNLAATYTHTSTDLCHRCNKHTRNQAATYTQTATDLCHRYYTAPYFAECGQHRTVIAEIFRKQDTSSNDPRQFLNVSKHMTTVEQESMIIYVSAERGRYFVTTVTCWAQSQIYDKCAR